MMIKFSDREPGYMKFLTAILMAFTFNLFTVLEFQLFAQSSPGSISIETKAEPTTVKIGDLITFSVIVTRGQAVEVELPGTGFTLLDSAGMRLPDDALNIRDYEFHEPEEVDGKTVESVDYIFSPFLIGKFKIAPMKVLYRVKPDSVFKELETEPLEILVESLKPSETGDIRDIKPPLEIERDPWEIIWPLLIAVGGLLLVISIIIIVKRIRAGKSILPKFEKPIRPPHEVALEELNKLQQSSLLAEGKIKQYYIQLSDIIRCYVEGRFFIPALEMTTIQLIDNLQRDQIDPEIITAISELLAVCDMVKFAKYKPKPEVHTIVTQNAFDIIHKTKLIIEEETAEDDPSDEKETEAVEETVEDEPASDANEEGSRK